MRARTRGNSAPSGALARALATCNELSLKVRRGIARRRDSGMRSRSVRRASSRARTRDFHSVAITTSPGIALGRHPPWAASTDDRLAEDFLRAASFGATVGRITITRGSFRGRPTPRRKRSTTFTVRNRPGSRTKLRPRPRMILAWRMTISISGYHSGKRSVLV